MEKRTGEMVAIHAGTFAVAEALMGRKLNPERARVPVILRVAVQVFGILPGEIKVSQPGSPPAD